MSRIDPATLDGLDAKAIDALTVGVIQLNTRGVVTLYNQAQATLSGTSASEALGRRFFQDVAPAANLPGFAGRFYDVVRSGAPSAGFTFTLGVSPSPLRSAIQIAKARPSYDGEEARYWIVVDPLERLPRARRRDALQAVEERARSGVVDAQLCEREPIHIPGAVQPHAALLSIDPATLRVMACSANIGEILESEAQDVLGRPIEALLPADLTQAIVTALEQGTLDPATPLRLAARVGADPRPVVALAHIYRDRLLIELEPTPTHADDFHAPSRAAIGQTIARLRQAVDLGVLGAVTTRDLAAMTGFERVLVYRFDRDWNGEAIAEWRDPKAYSSLLGLHFPSSDIPAQARALYTRAPARFVIDRDYVPVALQVDPVQGNEAVDLSFVESRSLSPIHLEYQRNLGVNGSMSASILVDGRLWGLVIGHHRRPHYTAPETRAAVTIVTDALAMRIGELENGRERRQREVEVAVETSLLQQIAGADDFTAALLQGEATLMDMFDAHGAAVVEDGAVARIGLSPSDDAVRTLAAWVAEQPLEDRVFQTEQLASALPAAADYPGIASGLLAAFTAGDHRRLILWFKPEEVSEVAWGGDPRKAMDASSGTLLPRRSFERWVEERRGVSTPWPDWQVEAARRIAGAVESVARRQTRKIMGLSATQAELIAALEDKERLLTQKDVLTREIDHRVKNSLQIVASFLQMQSRLVKDADARSAFDETYARVMSVARIHDSLYQSENVEEVDIGQTIATLCLDLSSMAGERHKLEVSAAPNLKISYQHAVGLSLIAAELVTNAFKYAYNPDETGSVGVEVRAREQGGVCLTVSDRGRGLPQDWSSAPRRSGLGMKLINAMLSQIGGEMTVESTVGARFTVCA